MNPSVLRQDARTRADALWRAVQRIDAVPVMLRLISEQTQLRFSAVAHVTEELWVACAVHDELDFGLSAGSELPVETTLCLEVRNQVAPIVIEHASVDPIFSHHLTPKLYKFESYVSVPIMLSDGSHFGNLCGLDPLPRLVADPKVQAMFAAYAALVGHLLDAELAHEETVQLLAAERSLAASREQFIAVVAHDLRNPLSAIATGTELITRFGEPAMSRIGERMKASTLRMSALLNDLVDFAKGRAGQAISINLAPRVDVAKGLAGVVYEFQDTNPEIPLTDELMIDAAIVCDLPRLQQLLSNLIANAIAYGHHGTPILVRAFIADDEAVLSVTNQGRVIAQADLNRIFEPYWRSDQQDKGTHLGLGLHICAQVAKAHRGTLTATSSAQTGTRFEMRWPVGTA